MKRGPGRPWSEGEPLATVTNIRLSNSEYDVYCVASLRAGISVNEYLRRCLRAGYSVFGKSDSWANPSRL